jgi:predicted metallo-beta-lactamase superfamily hydrolase
MAGRRVVCVGMWFDLDGNFYQYDFYEPSTDKVNECTYEEVQKMISDKILTLHQPEKGKVLKGNKWKR